VRREGRRRAVVVYLPGMHMNGAIPDASRPTSAHARGGGVRVWSVDYRTHFIPPTRRRGTRSMT
jgi:acetyl esterase/lipase